MSFYFYKSVPKPEDSNSLPLTTHATNIKNDFILKNKLESHHLESCELYVINSCSQLWIFFSTSDKRIFGGRIFFN